MDLVVGLCALLGTYLKRRAILLLHSLLAGHTSLVGFFCIFASSTWY